MRIHVWGYCDLNVDFLGLMQNANVSAKAANFKNKKFLLIHSLADGKFTINALNTTTCHVSVSLLKTYSCLEVIARIDTSFIHSSVGVDGSKVYSFVLFLRVQNDQNGEMWSLIGLGVPVVHHNFI